MYKLAFIKNLTYNHGGVEGPLKPIREDSVDLPDEDPVLRPLPLSQFVWELGTYTSQKDTHTDYLKISLLPGKQHFLSQKLKEQLPATHTP